MAAAADQTPLRDRQRAAFFNDIRQKRTLPAKFRTCIEQQFSSFFRPIAGMKPQPAGGACFGYGRAVAAMGLTAIV